MMVDLAVKLILYRVNETLSRLTECAKSFLWTPDGSLDVLSMFFIGWILLGITVYLLVSFISKHIVKLKSRSSASTLEPASEKLIVPVDVSNTHAKVGSSASVSSSSARPKGPRRARPASSDEEDVVAPVPQAFTGRPLPVADGPDSNSAKWANQVLGYLFSEQVAKNPNLTESWLMALNQQTLKAAPQHGLLVEFSSITVNVLNLREILVSPESGNNVTVHCRGSGEGIVFILTATRNTGHARTTQDYEVNISRLEGKLKIFCNTEDSLLVVRFLEKPDAVIVLKPQGTTQNWALPSQQSVDDIVREIVHQSLTTSIVDLPFDRDPSFPKYQKPKTPPSSSKPATAVVSSHVAADLHHPQQLQKHGEIPAPAAQHQQRLLVKIINANNLAQDQPCAEVYCVVEMDDPPQRFQTSGHPGTQNPFWGEHFLFSLKNSSAEILFEIFDRGKGNQFLGLGIVSVDELQKDPSQKHVIQLGPRPTHPKEVTTGTLTLEFLFMEGSEIPAKGLVEKNSRLTKTGALITTTTIQKPQEDVACLGGSRDGLDGRWSPPVIPLPDHSQYLLPKSLLKESSLNSLDHSSSDSEFIGPLENDEKDAPNNNLLSSYKCWDCEGPCTDSHGYDTSCSSSISSSADNSKLTTIPSSQNPTNIHLNTHSQEIFDINVTPFAVESVETASPETMASFLKPHLPNGNYLHDAVVNVPSTNVPPTENNNQATEVLTTSPCAIQSVPDSFNHKETVAIPSENIPTLNEPEKSKTLPKGTALLPVEYSPTLDKKEKSKTLPNPKRWFKAKKSGKTNQEDDSGSLANDSLADAALQELERSSGTGKQTSKSTLIIHSVQRVKVDRDGKWHEVSQTNGESPSVGTAGTSAEGKGPDRRSPHQTLSSDKDDSNRSRTKDRKSLMGALRKRLSFKKNRSRSVDQRSPGDQTVVTDGQDDFSARSISADRSSRNKDNPSGRDTLTVAGARLDAGSTRSSLSEGSGFSGASSRTYINENSTLVIELNENGLTKHYLIPYSLAARSKWRKKGGLKLHIYNDHTFVAKHITWSEQCQVCERKFSRRPGKQGYGCRDCGLQCHKTCHVKVESRCPNSTIQSLEMEYVQDPRARPKPGTS